MPDGPGRVHPTALISPEAVVSPDADIGAYAIVEGAVRLGPGCVVRPRAHLIGPLTMGRDNHVYPNAVIGERPQDFSYRGEPTGVEVGDGNTFRENVTVHRGTGRDGLTRIGSRNYVMAGAHIGHDCRVGDGCQLVNNALLGGHAEVGDGAYVSGNAAVHQFCRLGRLALLSGASITTKDVPPFVVQQGANGVAGVNAVGMARAGLTGTQVAAVRRAYRIVFLRGLALPAALAAVEAEVGAADVVREFVAFIRQSRRGINRVRR